jgi:ParB-like chromosome segregation protein Spo0J
MEWPTDQVERRPVAALVASARDARTHSDEQVTQIAASIREWGWTMPILVDEAGVLIAGHGRVLAARQLELAVGDQLAPPPCRWWLRLPRSRWVATPL